MKCFAACCVAVFISLGQARADESFHFDEKPGQYAVGFKVVNQYDNTRTFRGRVDEVTGAPVNTVRARPVQTLVWYPASAAQNVMSYGDYLRLAGSEDDYARDAAQVEEVAEARLKELVPADMTPATVARIKQTRMWAARDVAAIDRKFPLVIYAAGGNGSGFENADICEFLASHGYVVIASASIGTKSRWMNFDLDGVETQARDIEFLIAYGLSLGNVDPAQIAVIGYSWGGIANVFAAAKDDRIRALVGFDGGIRLVGKIVAEAKYVTPERLAIPFLYLSSSSGTFEDLYRQKQDLSDDLLARLKYSDLYVVTMLPMVHYQFASEHLRFLSAKPSEIIFPGDYSMAEVMRTYGMLARYTVNFLDGVLRNDEKSLSLVTKVPDEAEFPRHQIAIQVTLRSGAAPTRESFAEKLNARGFQHAGEIYKEFKAADDSWELKGGDLGDWVQELLALHRTADAQAIAELFAQVYPTRPGPYFWLATIHRQKGETAAAIDNLKKVIELNPNDQFAKSQLAELTGKPGQGGKR